MLLQLLHRIRRPPIFRGFSRSSIRAMPTPIRLHDDIEGKTVDLVYAEEPLGLPARVELGYPTVHFGQKLGPEGRFEIVRKLGWGKYSSVWLAKDHQNLSSFVAIKILTGHATLLVQDGILQELDIMRKCGPEQSHCTRFIETFILPEVTEEEGDHVCLAMEVFATDVERIWGSFPERRMPVRLVKKILRDTLVGISQLHALGCVHTDLTATNIMCRYPPITSTEAINNILSSDPSELNPPEQSFAGMVQSAKSQPLAAASLSENDAMACSYVLGDLGHAQDIDHPSTYQIAPEKYRPPEVTLGGPWNKSVDIWIFGCLVYEFLLGQPLFTRSHPTIPPDIFHISEMMKYLGQVFPVDILKDYQLADEILDLETGNFKPNPKIDPEFFPRLFRHWAAKRGLEERDIKGGLDLASRCLRLDPAERPSASELLGSCSWLGEVDEVK